MPARTIFRGHTSKCLLSPTPLRFLGSALAMTRTKSADKVSASGRKLTSNFFTPLGFHLRSVMLAQPFEHVAGQHVRPGMGEGFVHSLSQPVIDGCLLANPGRVARRA